MAPAPFLSRQERLTVTGSTNDVVRDWLAVGTPEVCLAVADEQTAGRGREGRTWIAPRGAALLASLGFRPAYLPPEQSWRLAATVSLAMADAAEEVAGLPDRAIRLKWPNDLVIEASGPEAPLNGELTENGARARLEGPVEVRKLAGVLGESEGLGTDDPRVIVGIGVNADWPASDFPAELGSTMTSLHEASGGRPVDLAPLLAAFLTRLEVRVLALRAGRFDVADWIDRQVTTGHTITIDLPDGATETARALGVDVHSGGLVVAAASAPGERIIHSAEIRHVRLAVPESAISGRERV